MPDPKEDQGLPHPPGVPIKPKSRSVEQEDPIEDQDESPKDDKED